MNTIQWSRKAQRQLVKIDKGNRQAALKIFQDVAQLQLFPNCPNIKRLTNHQYDYRLKVGHFRVFFEHDGVLKIISIEEVKKRNENTY
jgi:mRNA interferase RelE/StbE